ncbi:MAG: Rrf2 family transcriptional regulator, partial [Planctomycetes bacterium]|nr:Rrf2 family transcriptional regulator [Planctomycetota bacterium]
MLSLTRKTDYALLALTHLAAEPAAVISAREMAEQYCLSQPLLMNVLKQLSASGLVSSVRGARGGYTLAKSAEQIT